ncbi:catechol 2,3-dioxygenase [Xylanimonas ulmi]|uniref:Catechol 2,3-dioxygenase n=1 Tax=Xylanimonas ulmi TaxID=228973 RepID=A0A4Q7M3C0_9MICO|nr:catechol 2,3-dioxygenase [Xylanibacterium ulmi]RZS61463.1 catechol 2,3-dioxygenase [Xylanibacterium ulmi]
MGVLRMGYIHIRVTDLEAAKKHYIGTMGFTPTLEIGRTVYLKGWDEWDHHSVVLEEGGVGVKKFGFKVESPDDIDVIENKARVFGVKTERMSRGDNPEVSDGVRMTLPSTHVVEVYYDQTYVGIEVGGVNPDAFPRHLAGVGAPRIDHALMVAEDVNVNERFFMDVMDFYQVERLVPDLDHTECSLASWLSVGNRGHDIAILGGPPGTDGKIHHFAFQLYGWSEVLRASDIMSMDEVHLDVGPTRHGITRGQTTYFFDPSGNRNEVFSDGYVAYRDRPTTLWTADRLPKGIFYHKRQLNEEYTTVFT